MHIFVVYRIEDKFETKIRRRRHQFPKNATTGIVNQTQESSNLLGGHEDAEFAEIASIKLGQTENFGNVEEWIKTENKSLDAQEFTGNTEKLITEVTATDNNDQDFKQDGDGDSKDVEETTQDDRVNTNPKKIYVLSKEPNYDNSKGKYLQKANKAFRATRWILVLVWLAMLALVMDCGRSYVIRLISGKQMMQSSTTGHMNEIPESAKGGPRSPVKVKVKESSDLHRGQHTARPRYIFGLEFYRHYAIVLNVTVLTDRK
ncbi:hypothetical protein CHS0354_040805 [Potamilus streckersoni]|uniref:Uncharacterized protein n=1 Tax=Potamilus streckersoni TaxID=2493646 RepID=A0AAE0VXB6_9BIVA|nr:hypothetical protein CHS0354_040805 [Potamilus streckersoni]